MKVLYIDGCVREDSRTKIIAQKYLDGLKGEVEVVCLESINMQPLNGERLCKRDYLIEKGDFSNDIFNLANQFAIADEIVISAPFWDLSFPSLLKIYLENITVSGITFYYDNGRPIGLCKAKKLTYITTSGGPIFEDFGYSYVKALAKNFYGIKQTKCYRAENLDVKCVTKEYVLNEKILEIE